jgi:hypothetical protein
LDADAGNGGGFVTAATVVLPASVPSATRDELVHVICCRDDDPGEIALCGTGVADEPMVVPGMKTTCIVCADLETEYCDGYDSAGACPLMALAKGGER